MKTPRWPRWPRRKKRKSNMGSSVLRRSVRQTFGLRNLVLMAMLAGIAYVLMLLEFPLIPMAPFYKLHFAEVPILIGSYAMGPLAGVLIELVKIALKLLTNGTQTGFVGELADICVSCVYVVPAGLIYLYHRNKKGALISLGVGSVTAIVCAVCLNCFLLIPLYAKLFFASDSLDAILSMAGISSLPMFALLIVAPFNFIKFLLDSAIVFFLYRPFSRLIARFNGQKQEK